MPTAALFTLQVKRRLRPMLAAALFFAMQQSVLAQGATALDPPRQAQAPEPFCFCWADGRKIAEGTSVCIRTTQGRRIAACGRVQNLMSWEVSETPCPES